MSTKISNQDQKWLDKVNKLSEEGILIAKRSSMESAEYVDLLLSNFDDKSYCQNSLRNRDARFFGMYDLVNDLYSASVVYNPDADKLLRKEIEMKKTVTDLPTPEEVTRITANLDLANKLDGAVIAKLSNFKSKRSTPKIGELCGMDLLIDLSNAPEEAKYELYFKARTILEEVTSRTIANKD